MKRLELLADASAVLAGSLDEDLTMRRVARLIATTLGDACIIDRIEHARSLRRVVVEHPDRALEPDARALERHATSMPATLGDVVRSGIPAIVEDAAAAVALDEQDRDALARLDLSTAMIVPMPARGRVIGVLTIAATSPRSYDRADLGFAEDLARRTALALDNATLFTAMRQAEHRHRALVQNLDAIVWEATADRRRFTFVSRPVETILGYPVERWLGEDGFWEQVVHPDDAERVTAATRRRSGHGDPLEYRVVAADGRIVWVEDIADVTNGDGSDAPLLRGLMVDITARKNAEQYQGAQLAVMRAFAEAGSAAEITRAIVRGIVDSLVWEVGALWAVDDEHGAIRCIEFATAPGVSVPAFEAATREAWFARGAGLPGRVWESGEPVWIEDLSVEANFPRAPVARTDGLRAGFAFPIRSGGRVLGAIELFGRVVLHADEELLRFMTSVGAQIGQLLQRRAIEDLLQASEAEAAAVASSALDAIIGMNADGIVTSFNPAAETMFGYPASEAIGRTLADLVVPPPLRDDHRRGLRRFVETGRPKLIGQRMEMPAMRADGTEFPVELSITLIEGSRPPVFIGFVRDISEQKRIERALRDSSERAAFLAEASALLVTSTDPDEMMAGLTRLAVPFLADWCLVDLIDEDGTARRVAVHHNDPDKRALAETVTVRRHYEIDPDAPHGVPKVLRTGRPEIAEAIPREWIDRATETSPEYREELHALGLHAYMSVPLAARGRTLGAITFVSAESRRSYSTADLALAEDLARRAAIAIDNARLYRERSYVARTLQQSLLPPHLPEIRGIEVAARYHAAGEGTEVGGDFYDLFETGGDDWAIVIGDVCGKGARAAAVTALARYTVRAAAMQARKPSRVLSQLNEALLRQHEEDRFCTVAYARLRRGARGFRLTLGCAGHPLPYVLRRDGRIQQIGRPGTLLGVFPQISIADKLVLLDPGDTVVFYTDGVTEAGSPDGQLGDEGLRKLLPGCGSLDVATIAERIEKAVLSVDRGSIRDDLAVVVLRVRELDAETFPPHQKRETPRRTTQRAP